MMEEEGGMSATWWLPWKRCTSTTARERTVSTQGLAARMIQAGVGRVPSHTVCTSSAGVSVGVSGSVTGR